MAQVTGVSYPLNMDDLNLENLVYYTYAEAYSNYIILYDDLLNYTEFFGSGFTIGADGSVTGGTITRIRDVFDGGVTIDLRAQIPAATFYKWTINNQNELAKSTILAGHDTIAGTDFGDVLRGYGGGDEIFGKGGSDLIDGGAGNDFLNGGTGADRMAGKAGNDTYVVDNAGDVVVEASGQGTDTVNSSVSFSLAGQSIEKLALTGTANLNGTGNSLGNALVGNNGNNRLNGGTGADRIVGKAGNDTYVVDNTEDAVVEASGQGTDTVNSSVSFSIAGQSIEKLTLTGTANLSGVGNSLKNVLVGNSGNNGLNGGTGADRMEGKAGNDTYVVDNASDVVVEANGQGTDKVNSSVSFNLGGKYVENLTLTGTANLSGVGNSLSNILIGNSGSNRLNGGAGTDQLEGKAGNDILTGGLDADIFVFGTALSGTANVDQITDYSVADDTIWLENSIFTAVGAPGTLSASAFHTGAAAADAADRIIYDSATGALLYDSDGSDAGAAVQFATLSPGLGLTNADFLIV